MVPAANGGRTRAGYDRSLFIPSTIVFTAPLIVDYYSLRRASHPRHYLAVVSCYAWCYEGNCTVIPRWKRARGDRSSTRTFVRFALSQKYPNPIPVKTRLPQWALLSSTSQFILLCLHTQSMLQSENCSTVLECQQIVCRQWWEPSPFSPIPLHCLTLASYCFRHCRARSWHDHWPVRFLWVCIDVIYNYLLVSAPSPLPLV